MTKYIIIKLEIKLSLQCEVGMYDSNMFFFFLIVTKVVTNEKSAKH
jgi:hypothetical protein